MDVHPGPLVQAFLRQGYALALEEGSAVARMDFGRVIALLAVGKRGKQQGKQGALATGTWDKIASTSVAVAACMVKAVHVVDCFVNTHRGRLAFKGGLVRFCHHGNLVVTIGPDQGIECLLQSEQADSDCS